ncbi:hypothetical protein ASE75_14215 [Sphingomonas sp. Leaf17]|uniref:hypothetical protein n=1 Tax=Sphingomonas sp. Leaf17 TaxID=1735683 RepID=UPI0006FCCDE9|nr:hypothetical protein [Sphingomonas sp. Leaf17]KQM62766.1 hypothetical protein ASE75_14215 [Sphingomonas sp. Leaf17]
MLAAFLMGLVGGQRAMTPLATVAVAATRGELPADTGAPAVLAHPLVAAGAVALAIGEMAGDKQKTAPDRIVAIGLAGRFLTSAIAGAALSPRRHRWLGAAIGGATAIAAAYPGWRLRTGAMARHGQTATGFIEDAVVLSGAAAIVRGHRDMR